MCIDWSTDCLYLVKHSSNVNAFINHVGSKCEKLKASQVPPPHGYFFQVVQGVIMVVVNQINLDPSADMKPLKMQIAFKTLFSIRPLQLVLGALAAYIYIVHHSPQLTYIDLLSCNHLVLINLCPHFLASSIFLPCLNKILISFYFLQFQFSPICVFLRERKRSQRILQLYLSNPSLIPQSQSSFTASEPTTPLHFFFESCCYPSSPHSVMKMFSLALFFLYFYFFLLHTPLFLSFPS